MKTTSTFFSSRALVATRLVMVAGCVLTLTACSSTRPQLTPTPISLSTPTTIRRPTATPTSLPEATQTHTPRLVPTISGWKSYLNENYAFAFDYPSDVALEVSEKGPFEVRVSADGDNPFSISATRDYLPGEVTYFLDTAPSGQRVLGEYTWQTYELPEGYCDGPGCSPPLYALQMEVEQVLYKVVFYDQATMTPLQEQILSTFRLLN